MPHLTRLISPAKPLGESEVLKATGKGANWHALAGTRIPRTRQLNLEVALKSRDFRIHSYVSLHVQSQMVRSGETSVTMCALKWLGTGVFSEVSGQFITSCKTPRTALP